MPKAPKERRFTRPSAASAASKASTATATAASNPNDHLASATALSKKEKREQRKEQWLDKLSGVYDRVAASKHRAEKTKSLGVFAEGLSDIKDALLFEGANEVKDTTDEIASESNTNQEQNQQIKKAVHSSTKTESKQVASKSKNTAISQSARRKENLSEIVRMQRILTHTQFKSNPFETLKTHLANTIGK